MDIFIDFWDSFFETVMPYFFEWPLGFFTSFIVLFLVVGWLHRLFHII